MNRVSIVKLNLSLSEGAGEVLYNYKISSAGAVQSQRGLQSQRLERSPQRAPVSARALSMRFVTRVLAVVVQVSISTGIPPHKKSRFVAGRARPAAARPAAALWTVARSRYSTASA